MYDSNYLSYVKGKGDIWAAVVAKSVNQWGDEVTTFRLHYPRLIHSEFMTHRAISRNASSSRAIPVERMLEQVLDNPAMPVHWGKNQPGMQASKSWDVDVELDAWDYDSNALINETVIYTPQEAWEKASMAMVNIAKAFSDAGYHKQVVNRLLEPFQFMNVVASATSLENFFALRTDGDADPNIRELAHCMLNAYLDAPAEELGQGEWHTPYVGHERTQTGKLKYVVNGETVSVHDAIKISSSCAAQASYRMLDTGREKAKNIFSKLVNNRLLHASPFEHVATPFTEKEYMLRTRLKSQMEENGLLGADQMMYLGNFKGWTQYRKTLRNEVATFDAIR